VSNLNFNHLRYFRAVAHEGNLTKAAQRLFVSQSAVSSQIQMLEASFGQRLFDRQGKRLVLTEAGRMALDHADAIFSTGEELMSLMRTGAGSTRQILRIGALANLSRNFQLRFLSPVLRRDDVEIVVRSGGFADLLKKLETHHVDVVLANSAPARDDSKPWVAHEIAQQRVSLVRHRKRRLRGRTLKDWLSQEPLILPSSESSIRVGFDAWVERLGIQPRLAAEVDDMAMLRVLARENIGLAVVPSIVVKDELAAGLLVEVQRLPVLKEHFFAITLRRRFPNPLVRALLDASDRQPKPL